MNESILMKRFITLAVIVVFTIATSYSQEEYPPEELFDEGQYFFIREDYKEAVYFYKQLVNKFPENANYNFKAGECYLNIPGQEHLAVSYFEKAVKNIVPKRDYKSRSFDEVNAPLHALFYLGNAYRAAGRLDDALKAYNTFLDSPYFFNNYNQGVVEREIKSCERAKIIQDAPVDYSQQPFDSDINTPEYSEFNPVISRDGNTLVFVRGLKFYDAVFVTKKTKSGWTTPRNINEEIVSDGDYYPTGLNRDGTKMLLVRDADDNSEIYISEYIDSKWAKAKKLPGKINSLMDETYANYGADDKTIVFVSDRAKSRGGKDIFISRLNKKGKWGGPKGISKKINTELNEDTPVFCNDGKTLFFSSEGHFNMGGYDIFYSYLGDKEWSTPKNIGYPINSTRNDLFYMVMDGCNSAIYSIIDKDSGLSDLYLIELKEPLAVP